VLKKKEVYKMSYDVSALQSQFKTSLNSYNNWKKASGKNYDFLTYERLYSKNNGLGNVFQGWENVLEGGKNGDGAKGNTLSADRYYASGNTVYLQAADGTTICMNAETGEITTGDAATESLGAKFDVTDGSFSNIDFGSDSVTFESFSFADDNNNGIGDITAKTASDSTVYYVHEELDMAGNGIKLMQGTVDEYKHDHNGKFSSLKDLFSGSKAKTVVDSNFSDGSTVDVADFTTTVDGMNPSSVNYLDNNNMLVLQNGKCYVVGYVNGKVVKVEVTPDNITSLGFPNVDPNQTVTDINFTTDANGVIIPLPTYAQGGSDGTGGSGVSGDPHFSDSNGQYVFDFQGAGGGSTGNYTLLKNKDVTWTADFGGTGIGGDTSTVIVSQHLSINTKDGIVVVDSRDGNVNSVTLNGQTVNPGDYGITISGSQVTYDGQNFTMGNQSASVNTVIAGSTGLLTQSADLSDGTASNDTTDQNQIMVNSGVSTIAAPVKITQGQDATTLANGFIATAAQWQSSSYFKVVFEGASPNINDKTDVDFNYNPAADKTRTTAEKAELCARIAYAAMTGGADDTAKTKCVANWIEWSSKAMAEDEAAAKKAGNSIASGYTAGHGYSASQWNEYHGTVAFGTKADINKDGIEDAAIDDDNDGVTDGFDLNGDGILQDNEKVVFEVNTSKTNTKNTKTTKVSFLG
jgi:hypothetical protein